MTLRDLEEIAADAQEQGDARRMMAGAYVAKALRALRARNWSAARLDLIEAAHRRPELAEALRVVDAAERVAATSAAKSAAARKAIEALGLTPPDSIPGARPMA